jgi:pimeloyl-ACP methyl ester carboxylesterase
MNSYPLPHDVTGAGEPFILVPGGLSGWLSWVPFVEPLVKDRRVIRVQLRSIELAEAGQPIPAVYGTLMEREALHAVADQLGLTSFDLVGWSYGGHIALAFALEYPQHVRTLTVIEPPAFWITRETGRTTESFTKHETHDRAAAGREITISDLKEFLVRAGFGQPGDDFESMPGWPVWARNRQSIATNGTIWDYVDSLDRLRKLDVPVLAVRGTETTDVLAAIAEDVAEQAPRGRLLELPGGHACHIQNMNRFLAELAEHTAVAIA